MLDMRGPFARYIQSVAVREEWRNRGVGRKLIGFAEEQKNTITRQVPVNRQWVAEVEVSTQLAQLLIKEQFPECAPVRIEALGDGWDNTAYLINNTWVFRFPRRQIAVELLETENRVLPLIAPLLPLPVPVPLFTGKPSESYRWPFSGYRLIEGETACSLALCPGERIQLAPALARFLRALHDMPVEKTSGADPDKIHRLDLEKRVPHLFGCLDNLAEKGFIRDSTHIKRFVRRIRPRPVPSRITLVHGDFYARHLLLDGNSGAAGVIDWGDLHIGDPAIDIAIACSFLPREGRSVFRELYGDIDEYTWDLASFKALYTTIMLLSYAYDKKEGTLIKEANTALQLILDDEK